MSEIDNEAYKRKNPEEMGSLIIEARTLWDKSDIFIFDPSVVVNPAAQDSKSAKF